MLVSRGFLRWKWRTIGCIIARKSESHLIKEERIPPRSKFFVSFSKFQPISRARSSDSFWRELSQVSTRLSSRKKWRRKTGRDSFFFRTWEHGNIGTEMPRYSRFSRQSFFDDSVWGGLETPKIFVAILRVLLSRSISLAEKNREEKRKESFPLDGYFDEVSWIPPREHSLFALFDRKTGPRLAYICSYQGSGTLHKLALLLGMFHTITYMMWNEAGFSPDWKVFLGVTSLIIGSSVIQLLSEASLLYHGSETTSRVVLFR